MYMYTAQKHCLEQVTEKLDGVLHHSRTTNRCGRNTPSVATKAGLQHARVLVTQTLQMWKL